MCMTCTEPATDRRLGRVLLDPAPEAPPVRWRTPEELHADFLRWNAAQPNPLPICPACDVPCDLAESHPLLPTICGLCGTQRIDDLVMNLACARGKKARKKAAKRLRKLATK
jgi:hypothetical protein